MIETSRVGDEIVINVTAERRPRLYFDQFALYEFAKPENSEPFFQRFDTHGELLFSHINMFEVGLLRDPSESRLREFFRKIGVHWVPIDFEFTEVIVRENERKPQDPHPALSQRLLKFVYESGTLDAPITLDKAVGVFATADRDAHRRDLDLMKSAMASHVADWQSVPAEEIERQYPVVSSAGPTMYLASRLIRALIDEAKAYRWTPNDAFDFVHALVPLVYADAIFLDKQWKGRIERLSLEGSFATIFYGNETQRFFEWFDQYVGE